MKADMSIPFLDFMAAVESEIADNTNTRRLTITDEQRQFITTCRFGKNKLSYTRMCILWEEAGWGYISETSLRRRMAIVSRELETKANK